MLVLLECDVVICLVLSVLISKPGGPVATEPKMHFRSTVLHKGLDPENGCRSTSPKTTPRHRESVPRQRAARVNLNGAMTAYGGYPSDWFWVTRPAKLPFLF